ncbi:4-hydroxy-tetrahydrodipicolinate synthase [Ornithinimicrobium ciconiae]|uniref:4-hydroxy-tetrahydrodipicolinate synthase n=1 Tax=Ornithinimicrobium ciconiae TaxID=2594265 RepID=A0A516G9J3_9MICO|nr:4-hydroxy-tetrahydrodipicolinate synthase [Ornithinimicrobium ciconiae]QDO88197.1 4-hydroxy-tetrahydrodipicolinate synthase [Ornithinimicrobium ciconiae]
MSGAQFTGLGVALATPFTTGTEGAAKPASGGGSSRKRPAVDLAAYRTLVQHVVAGGADFLVVLGSTGEAATVDESERADLIATAREAAPGVPIVVGTGHNNTEYAVELSRAAVAGGADGLLVVSPYYNKPQPAGIVAHFRAITEELPGVPIIAYNVPGRTGSNLTPETLRELWAIPEVVAVKESSGDLRQMVRICQEAPAGKTVLAGDDDLALPAIAVGATGLVSVCGNVAPAETAELVRAAMVGDLVRAREFNAELAPLMAALFAETNPVPLKAALACLGLATGMVRLPLVPAAPDTWARIQSALSALALTPHHALGGVDSRTTARPVVREAVAS